MAVVKSPKNTNNKKLWRIRYRKLYTKSSYRKTPSIPKFNLKVSELKNSPTRILDLYPQTTIIRTTHNGKIIHIIGYKKDFFGWERKKKNLKTSILTKKYLNVKLSDNNVLVSTKLFRIYSWFLSKSNQWSEGNLDNIPSLRVQTKLVKSKKIVTVFSKKKLDIPSPEEEEAVSEETTPDTHNKNRIDSNSPTPEKLEDGTTNPNEESVEDLEDGINNQTSLPGVEADADNKEGDVKEEKTKPVQKRKKKIVKIRKKLTFEERMSLPLPKLPPVVVTKRGDKPHKIQLKFHKTKDYSKFNKTWKNKKNKKPYRLSFLNATSSIL